MELEVAVKLIEKYVPGNTGFIQKANTAYRYYRKKNDILYAEKEEENGENPLRNADNRIPSNFYKLLVNQKAAYMFTSPPLFDVGSEESNRVITEVLGDSFRKKCKALCVQAANCSVGWLHYWKNEQNKFKYAVVDARQIIPIWTRNLEKELLAVLRVYTDIDEVSGDTYTVYEIWTDKECSAFRRKQDEEYACIQEYVRYTIVDVDTQLVDNTNIYQHDFGEVPFIFFNNNDEMQNDLEDIKQLIDSYDKVFSGFINDLEDIQELIFILTNYGGEESSSLEILKEMKHSKLLQVDSDGADDKSGISTLSIEIPVEARKEFLTITRKAIFEQGMGIDPDPQNFGNSSGVALRYLYSLLELKAGMMETEFAPSFSRLVKAILRFYGRKADAVKQTWTRTFVNNDTELADIASKSQGVISKKTIVRNHPWVENPEEEIKLLEEEEAQNMPKFDKVPIEGDDDE